MIISIMAFLIYFIFGLVLPLIIVIKWRSRPVLALIAAIFLAFLGWVSPGIIRTFMAMMIYGTGDPQLMAGGLSVALARAFLSMPLIIPILAFVQWVSRRRAKRSEKTKDVQTAFE